MQMRAGHPRMISIYVWCIVAVLLAACGGDTPGGLPGTTTSTSAADGVGGGSQGGDTQDDAAPGVRQSTLILRGTAGKPAPEGFVELPGACAESRNEAPTLGPMSTYVPEDWQPGGATLGQSFESGSVSYLADGTRVTVDTRLLHPDWQNDYQPHPETVLNALGEDIAIVAHITWAGEQIEVLHNGTTYAVILPIMTIEGDVPSQGEYVMAVTISEGFDDDEGTRETFLTMLEGLASHECVTESFTYIMGLTVVVES